MAARSDVVCHQCSIRNPEDCLWKGQKFCILTDATIPTTPESSPSGQAETANGPAAPSSDCVHFFLEMIGDGKYLYTQKSMVQEKETLLWCRKCGALKCGELIIVPAVGLGRLILASSDNKNSVASSETTARSPWRETSPSWDDEFIP